MRERDDRAGRGAAASDLGSRAHQLGAYIHVDMEQYSSRALTYELFCRVLEEPDFRDWPDVGIVVQAYQGDAERELEMLHAWVVRRERTDHRPAGQRRLLGL